VIGIAEPLIQWHARHGRHDLPWQIERTPYRVWVSEIMLQQTQVATVMGYYERFIRRFPDIATLACAPLDEVLHLWSGLGYYSRARNLQRAAQCVLAEHGGSLPDEREALARLPGIGRSAAAAIIALAHGRREPILDGNVKRVLARYFGIDGAPGKRETQKQLWRRAEQCTPEAQVELYTQAIMDFGATLCTRRKPACTRCPLSARCIARRSGRVEQLPTARTVSRRPRRGIVMLLARRKDGQILLQRRPERGVWGGLWTLPEFTNQQAARRFCRTKLQRARLASEPLPLMRHAFTHFVLEITPLRASCSGTCAVMEGPRLLWYNPREPARIGLPAPIAALLSTPGNIKS
jgi:A/G-specific adenine glycosylase